MRIDRRRFLVGGFGATILASMSADLFAESVAQETSSGWDSGQVRHLIPTVSERDLLIKASFVRPLTAAPSLRIGASTFPGRMNDTQGECWQFRAKNLEPGRRYVLSIRSANGRPLCEQ